MDFTERKFKNLEPIRQHKKCAELLRQAYVKSAKGVPIDIEQNLYFSFLEWMGIKNKLDFSLEGLADSYHTHLKSANQQLKEHNLLPAVRTQDRAEAMPALPIAIYLDNIRSAYNVGSIIRTAEAFSLGKLWLSPSTPTPMHKQVQDSAMGTDRWVSWEICHDIHNLPRPVIALETCSEAIAIQEFIFPDSFTLILGNEEYGCSSEMMGIADYFVEIPLRGRKNSLNVANAFAISAAYIALPRL